VSQHYWIFHSSSLIMFHFAQTIYCTTEENIKWMIISHLFSFLWSTYIYIVSRISLISILFCFVFIFYMYYLYLILFCIYFISFIFLIIIFFYHSLFISVFIFIVVVFIFYLFIFVFFFFSFLKIKGNICISFFFRILHLG